MKRESFITPGPGLALLALALLSALPAVSCAKKTAAADAEHITIIYDSNVIARPLVTLAKELHYFEEEGLDPEFIILASGAIEALSIGKADIMLNGIIPSLSYGSQGAAVKVVGGTASGGNFVVTKPENAQRYARLEDWRGVRLGTVRLSTSEMVSRYALGPLGVDLGQDVTFVEIDNYANIIEAVRKGQVDIGFIGSEYRRPAVDLGLHVLFPMTHMYPNYVCCRETAYAKAVEERRSIFVKFHQAQIRAYKYFLEKPDEVLDLFARISSQERDYVYNVIYNTETNADRIFNPDPDLRRVTSVYQTLLENNYIERTGIEARDIVDITIYKDALDNILTRYPNDPVYLKLAAEYEVNNVNF
ncbi:MAG: ABC transporter substrate-binding protein [Treponema sp.]|nr:ABC transporter substrate-binding protein [Treponema sp.]